MRYRTDGSYVVVQIACSVAARHAAANTGQPDNEKVRSMLYTIAVVLVILWALGLVTSYTMGGFVHVLLVVAVIMILVNFIGGRRSL